MNYFPKLGVLVLAGSSAWAAADPQLLNLMMPDAKVLAGVQVEHAKTSPFGQFLLAQAGPIAQFDQLKAAIGFDPRTDLSEVVVGSTGASKPNQGLLAGHGTFPASRIAGMAALAGAVSEEYRGLTLLGNKPGTAGAGDIVGVFLNASTVVAGDRALVKAAVDRWILPGTARGALVDRALAVSASAQAWGVATGLAELTGKVMPTAPNAPPQAAAVQNLVSAVNQVSGGLNFGATDVSVRGQAVARSAEDAQSLADVMRFMLAMAQQSPLAGGVQVESQGSAVNFSLSLMEAQAEGLLKPKTTAIARSAAARR
ncbi:MAG: hypothetical protein ABI995_13230 [Acidobacteriota bacterium]